MKDKEIKDLIVVVLVFEDRVSGLASTMKLFVHSYKNAREIIKLHRKDTKARLISSSIQKTYYE